MHRGEQPGDTGDWSGDGWGSETGAVDVWTGNQMEAKVLWHPAGLHALDEQLKWAMSMSLYRFLSPVNSTIPSRPLVCRTRERLCFVVWACVCVWRCAAEEAFVSFLLTFWMLLYFYGGADFYSVGPQRTFSEKAYILLLFLKGSTQLFLPELYQFLKLDPWVMSACVEMLVRWNPCLSSGTKSEENKCLIHSEMEADSSHKLFYLNMQ